MYNPKIKIIDAGISQLGIIDESEYDEIIVSRTLTITNGYGDITELEFPSLSNIIYIKTDIDMAYKIEYVAVTETADPNTTYNVIEYYLHTTKSEAYLLKLMNGLHCKNNCSIDISLQAKIFEIINNIEGAKRFTYCKEIYKAQRLLDYISDYYCTNEVNYNCCNRCGAEY